MRNKIWFLIITQTVLLLVSILGVYRDLALSVLGLVIGSVLAHLFLYHWALEALKFPSKVILDSKEILGHIEELYIAAGKGFAEGDEELGNFYLDHVDRLKGVDKSAKPYEERKKDLVKHYKNKA